MNQILCQKIDRFKEEKFFLKSELAQFINDLHHSDKETHDYLFATARTVTESIYGTQVFIRGLIEFSNFCHNNCYYCGIRKSNSQVQRYRLTKEEILLCTDSGYDIGFRTFVLQSGEDDFYSAQDIAEIVYAIRERHPDCAVTLSLGEKTRKEYEIFREAGAERYLLRHESADETHYKKLKPPDLKFNNRLRCLKDLKELGFQTGAGFMVGSPFQTELCLAEDLIFLHELQPEMVGIGPFIPHHATPFKDFPKGSVDLTLILISLIRLMLPNALIPATTALGTADPKGREKGLLAGANVSMPNLSPLNVRKQYQLYDNKICTGSEAAECMKCLKRRVEEVGRKVVVSRGDFKP